MTHIEMKSYSAVNTKKTNFYPDHHLDSNLILFCHSTSRQIFERHIYNLRAVLTASVRLFLIQLFTASL